MEYAGASAANALRVGLNVAIQRSRPELGSRRAETITLTVDDEFRRGFLKWSEIFNYLIHQMAPRQLIHLFRLDLNDLHSDDDKLLENRPEAVGGIQRSAHFLGADALASVTEANTIPHGPAFNAKHTADDLPPARYA
jgi:hypothetical protein